MVEPTSETGPVASPELKGSRLGIASFAISIFVPIYLYFAFLFGTRFFDNIIAVPALFTLGGMAILMGIGLGIAEVACGNRKKIFAIIGLTLNSLELLSLAVLVILVIMALGNFG